MKKITTKIAYTGEDVDSGLMDVNDLAPALLALGDLISEANNILNKNNSRTRTYISSDIKTGSFEVKIQFVQQILEQIKGMFGNGSVYDVAAIFAMIFGTTSFSLGCAAKSANHIKALVEFYRWLKTDVIKAKKELDNGNTLVILEERQAEVLNEVLQLYENSKVRKLIENTIKPVNEDGIDGFEIRDEASGNPLERIDKKEIEEFKYRETIEIEQEEVLLNDIEVFLTLLTPQFDKEISWRFEHGNKIITAEIQDKEFLERIKSHEISFFEGTVLQCKVLFIQTLIKGGKPKEKYIVNKVIQIIQPYKQDGLFPTS